MAAAGGLAGRVALVTGGARGIGAAVAAAFVAEGARVVVADVLDAEGKQLADALGDAASYVHLDVSESDAWRTALGEAEATFGPVSVLVNNAGVVEFATIEASTDEVFRRVLEIDLVGAFFGMRAVLPSMRRAGGGVIVNISSTAGLIGYAGIAGYVSAKWGMRGLTKAAALEFAADGIRVCSVHPGPIRTPMTAGMGEASVAGQPIERFGEPDEVAAMVAFVAGQATFSTGSEFVVDGGATAGVVPVLPASS
ncbi:SDR family NAD(P)-dependent oxidoreductase [Blastococcus tunisiensis]|jgi:3alpha(or 20beta)-hydroxysteroid dehydrogenase|uniref:3alpha(Or 20beta)-hydroxysteroid dehydrogenase n=1 Tax=Blastococcus tunisiensis TaxID=1798228 RepID=A0A1I2DYH9_9ACTN|nr:SDR family NAD(P)-dependent oxidoreductase [Blastococcus sp. DSM 46838]SFE85675.1 3alpha(or 20beta)-hydroxysteroid dehydrogenase [Blastococcus sp. DSM 46838]